MDLGHYASLLALAGSAEHAGAPTPPLWANIPFVAILLAIAILPLVHATHHWWEQNRNKLMVSLGLGGVTLVYYLLRSYGTHGSAPGLSAVLTVLEHALLIEYLPFMALLFSLYVIAGGVVVRGDIDATPATNTLILAIGAILASAIGTTGASMVLIRLLLRTNRDRTRVVHTVVFFIFLVSNIGGTLLPIGDPPLFLGYLRGVPFFWTFKLGIPWGALVITLLLIYWAWDTWAYRKESPAALAEHHAHRQPLRLGGWINLLLLMLVVVAVASLDPAKPVPLTEWKPFPYLREGVLFGLAGLSLLVTPRGVRGENQFNYAAIGEVAALFLGIFITMQVPIEILHTLGPWLAERGLTQPWQFFWATGLLSSFLDNAPTYVVFFETANSLTHEPAPNTLRLLSGAYIDERQLVGISLGAVFMGANTYIGNGPNFMVKTIAEQSGVRMPSFFGYMIYSSCILIPLFIALSLLFFR